MTQFIVIITIAFFVVVVVAINVWDYRYVRNGEWHSFRSLTMKRWVNGKWESRPMTDEEVQDYVVDKAI